MLLPYHSSYQAKCIADEIREIVAEYDFTDVRTGKRSVKDLITVSLGVSSVDLSQLSPKIQSLGLDKNHAVIRSAFDVLYRNADVALDYAKFLGRNRVEIFCEHLAAEMARIKCVREFYFKLPILGSAEVNEILKIDFMSRNPKPRNKIKKHFHFIRTEVHSRDLRTISLLADNLYKVTYASGYEIKRQFINYLHGLNY